MIKIDDQFIEQTSQKAKASERLRMNYNFHNLEDPINRLLNAMEPGTYIQPHKHEDPDRFEVFLCLRGSFLIMIFDEKGNLTDHTILDPKKGQYGVEIPAKVYHSLASLEPGSVAYEIKEGPYVQATAKNFAPWAPAEGEHGTQAYLSGLLKQAGINQ
jgi:cupin fold WbuC family metalloprotein